MYKTVQINLINRKIEKFKSVLEKSRNENLI